MKDYAEFLKSKEVRTGPCGFKPTFLPDCMKDFQRHLAEWNVRTGRSADYADCGLGKSLISLVFAENVVRRTNRPVLIACPLAVSRQFAREGEKFGIPAKVTQDGKVYKGINVTNYERLKNYRPEDFAAVVLDECFVAGTKVQIPSGSIDIEKIRPGDRIINASGVDEVVAVKRRELPYAIRIKTNCGKTFVSSGNHPFFTRRGYVGAGEIRPGDSLVETTTAMRLVRGDYNSENNAGSDAAFLQSELLGEMENASTGIPRQRPQRKSGSETRQKQIGMVQARRAESSGDDREIAESPAHRRSNSKNDRNENEEWNFETVERSERGQWKAAPTTARDSIFGFEGPGVGSGVPDIFGEKTSGLSYLLQSGYGESADQSGDRGRWAFPQQSGTKIARSEEGREIGFVGVVSVEVLESGHPDLAPYRDAEGALYFYDLEAKRHPSFSVNECLVHNSGILKNFEGKFRKDVTKFMAEVKWRLLATATPAPNDFMELGTSSEALGSMTRNQMLSMFFANDGESTQQWRLKGPAKGRFWAWVGTWARALRKPSDLGFDDSGYVLPPLVVEQHVLPSNRPRRGFFAPEAKTLSDIRTELRATLEARCGRAAELVPKGKQCVVWCHTNPEGDLLERLIPGAVQVAGKDKDEVKEERLLAFANGEIATLVTKPKIAGWGLNLQRCSEVIYFPSFSFESYYQAVRRCWRFGQENPVTCRLVASSGLQRVLDSMLRKERQSDELYTGIVKRLAGVDKRKQDEEDEPMELPPWLANGRNGK